MVGSDGHKSGQRRSAPRDGWAGATGRGIGAAVGYVYGSAREPEGWDGRPVAGSCYCGWVE